MTRRVLVAGQERLSNLGDAEPKFATASVFFTWAFLQKTFRARTRYE